MQSRELTHFYKEMKKWIDGGLLRHESFLEDYGLCSNLSRFCDDQKYDHDALGYEMREQFRNANLSDWYPFNDSIDDYDYERKYDNQARLDWINDHAAI